MVDTLLKTLENHGTIFRRMELVHNRYIVIQEGCANYLYLSKINNPIIHIPTTLTTITSSISI